MALVEADLRSLSLCTPDRRAIAEADGGLWHFAANTTLRAGSGSFTDDVWAVNDQGTQALLDVVFKSARPGPYFHMSTAYVCGTDAGSVYEDRAATPSGFRNSYEASKHSAEVRVRSAFEAGLPGAIFRPSVIVGDELTGGVCKAVDLLGDALMKSVDRRNGPLVLRLPDDAAINVVHADWIVESLMALASSDANPTTYHLTSRAPLKLAELARVVCPEFPDSALVMDPHADLRSLSPLSRTIDRALGSLRPYLTAKVMFDRENFNAAAPSLRSVPEFDPQAVFDCRAKLLTQDLEAVG
jgi:nucleoside-diphosphate-sugar epimerase